MSIFIYKRPYDNMSSLFISRKMCTACGIGYETHLIPALIAAAAVYCSDIPYVGEPALELARELSGLKLTLPDLKL